MVFVPIAHDLVHAATVHTAGQAAHVLYPVTKERGTRRKFQVVDEKFDAVHTVYGMGYRWVE